jgi:hypothetical protein
LVYFGEMACGNVAPGLKAADPVPGDPVVVVGVPGPQFALRNCCHVKPPSVPLACAALYLTLHSCMVSAVADCVPLNVAISPMQTTEAVDHNHIIRSPIYVSQRKNVPIVDFGAYRGLHRVRLRICFSHRGKNTAKR